MLSPLREVFCVCVFCWVLFISFNLHFIFCSGMFHENWYLSQNFTSPMSSRGRQHLQNHCGQVRYKEKKSISSTKKKTRTKPHHFNQTNKQWFSLLHSTFVTQNLVSNGVIRVFKLLTLLVGTNQIFLCNTYLISCVGIVVDAVPK